MPWGVKVAHLPLTQTDMERYHAGHPMKTIIVEKTVYGFAPNFNQKWLNADLVLGKINDNKFQVLKDRSGELKFNGFYKKEDLFLELI